jgi:hypothetical protein
MQGDACVAPTSTSRALPSLLSLPSLPSLPPPPLRPLLYLALLAAAGGCAPSVSPLYRDFALPAAPADSARALELVREAMVEAGWTPAPAVSPAAVSTQVRTVSDVGLYRTEVHLDAVPLGGRHVRVFFHPYRRYVTGGRSKVPYLGSGLRRRLLSPLAAALERRGLVLEATAQARDRERDGS